jgi:hypothetical protein
MKALNFSLYFVILSTLKQRFTHEFLFLCYVSFDGDAEDGRMAKPLYFHLESHKVDLNEKRK